MAKAVITDAATGATMLLQGYAPAELNSQVCPCGRQRLRLTGG
jgi:hypothetical protein